MSERAREVMEEAAAVAVKKVMLSMMKASACVCV
jgi:hypothetical protein